METTRHNKVLPILKWSARALSIPVVAFLGFMGIAHLIDPEPLAPAITTQEVIMLICFPTGVIFGLLMAWRWAGLGGLVTLLSLAVFHLVGSEANFNILIDAGAIPALLFLIYWFVKWKSGHEQIAVVH